MDNSGEERKASSRSWSQQFVYRNHAKDLDPPIGISPAKVAAEKVASLELTSGRKPLLQTQGVDLILLAL